MTRLEKRRRTIPWILLVLLAAGILLDLNAGYAKIPLSELFSSNPILWQLRLPRVLASVLVGIGLALSGTILQGVSRNDMADPGLMGINAGSSLAIALLIVLFQGMQLNYSLMLPILAFVGAILVFSLEYRLALENGHLNPKELLMMGVAISLALNALTTIVMLRLPDSQYAFVQNWIAGNIWGAEWPNLLILAAGILMIGSFVFCRYRSLNGLMLGHEVATGIGIDTRKESKILLFCAVGLSALCCSIGGGLSFIGLIAPHLTRKLVGANYRYLLLNTALVGGVLLVYADMIARTCFVPYEMPIGLMSAIIGSPYFLYLLIKE